MTLRRMSGSQSIAQVKYGVNPVIQTWANCHMTYRAAGRTTNRALLYRFLPLLGASANP